MVTSANMKMEDDIVYMTVLKHKLELENKFGVIKTAPLRNGMNLTPTEYREFLSSLAFFQNFMRKWLNEIYFKNGVQMPYNPKELYTSVKFQP